MYNTSQYEKADLYLHLPQCGNEGFSFTIINTRNKVNYLMHHVTAH